MSFSVGRRVRQRTSVEVSPVALKPKNRVASEGDGRVISPGGRLGMPSSDMQMSMNVNLKVLTYTFLTFKRVQHI